MREEYCPPPFRHWMRHMAAVPKGFLRYQVLELLNKRPLSGSEIMEEVKKMSNGCWRPSPGSVYPLFAWLKKNGYVKEVRTPEIGIKRYALTERGKKLLEDQRRIKAKIGSGKFMLPPLFGSFWFGVPPEKTGEIRRATRRLIKTFFDVSLTLEDRHSEKEIEEVVEILDEAAAKLEAVEKKLEGKDERRSDKS
ncbi:MAG: PadR family transcriptional regulator [Candidatus Hadarchaeum sp.]|uniref:PadR family transcriptional regulator n=1 Tax=Candidatus Hadarchaeum sp. TaxID=2883567 RepID=UPI003D0C9A42